MLEEDVFEKADDAYDRLEKDNLYKALMGDLEESKRIKRHLVERYTQDIKDIEMRIESVKQAKRRAYNG